MSTQGWGARFANAGEPDIENTELQHVGAVMSKGDTNTELFKSFRHVWYAVFLDRFDTFLQTQVI